VTSIVVRMVFSDLAFIAGVLLLQTGGDETKLLSPLHAVGWAAVIFGGLTSAWLTLALVRYAARRRAAAGDGQDGDGS
jgi:hypothetical protein